RKHENTKTRPFISCLRAFVADPLDNENRRESHHQNPDANREIGRRAGPEGRLAIQRRQGCRVKPENDERDADCRQHGLQSPLPLVVALRPQTSPANTIAGPMMLRMSTRKSVSRSLPGLSTNAWIRNRNARTKISRPRREIVSTAARRLPVRRTVAAADNAR